MAGREWSRAKSGSSRVGVDQGEQREVRGRDSRGREGDAQRRGGVMGPEEGSREEQGV